MSDIDLLDCIGGYSDRAFLNVIKASAPHDLAKQFMRDNAFELRQSDLLTIDDFMKPLKTCRWPSVHLSEFVWILGELIGSYAKEEVDHVGKALYYAAMYLNCAKADQRALNTGCACVLLVRSALQMKIDVQMHCVKYLLHLASESRRNGAEKWMCNPMCYYDIGVHLLWGNVFGTVRRSESSLHTLCEDIRALGVLTSSEKELWVALCKPVVGEIGIVPVTCDQIMTAVNDLAVLR